MLDLRRWPHADSLLDRALELPANERAAFVEREAADPGLAATLQRVLAEAERQDDFLVPGGALSGPLFDDLLRHGDDDVAALAEGQRLGPYRIDRRIGRGGMGQVYRARDLRLGRDVAIKVLPPSLAQDPERLARFQREARMLAALSHPGIATIHDLHEEPGLVALVLELVEGPTLADRLTGGPMPVAAVLPIARQLVDAIAAAHDRGIIHRDLKPSNIKLTPDGFVKVLDFGLARAVARSGDDEAGPSALDSITLFNASAGAGVLGTAAYMSPEQARGERVDHRVDVWAFGCILYEMLTGTRAFPGNTASEVIARVLEREPDYARFPASTPPALVRLVGRCLRKEASRRLGYIGDARFELEGEPEAAEAPAIAPAPSRRRTLPWLAGGVLAALLGAGVTAWLMHAPPVPVSRVAIPLPPSHSLVIGQLPALSRSADGRTLVYRAVENGVMRLFVRHLDGPESQPLPATEHVMGHAISPDGRWVVYGGDGKLLKVPIDGGTPVTICDAPGGAFVAWGSTGAIVFASGTSRNLFRVDSAGGTPVPLTTLDPVRDSSHGWPAISPDGRTVAFTIETGGNYEVAVIGIDGGEVRVLGEGRSPQFASDDLLLFARGRSLWAGHFDARRLAWIGEPVEVMDGIAQAGANGYMHAAPAADGSLAFIPAAGPPQQALVWLDREGREVGVEYEGRAITRYALSPDGSRIALASFAGDSLDIWVFDRARRTLGRLTGDRAADTAPVWSPDGRRIVFRSDRDGGGLFTRASDAADDIVRLTSAGGLYHTPYTFTPDGSRLLFVEFRDYRQQDVLSVRMDGSRIVERVLTGPYAELRPALSPDGRWLAYQSDESGRFEVYVRPFPHVQRARWQVSTRGGSSPMWRRDGRELFFAGGGALMSAAIEAGESFKAGRPQRLFEVGGAEDRLGPLFDLEPDGSRFLVLRTRELRDPAMNDVRLVQGWVQTLPEELRR